MIKPVFTEKSLAEAKKGRYSFWVDVTANKLGLKSEISRVFGVNVVSIRTVNGKSEQRRNVRGGKFSTKFTKKAIVTLKDGEKLDLFEEAKK